METDEFSMLNEPMQIGQSYSLQQHQAYDIEEEDPDFDIDSQPVKLQKENEDSRIIKYYDANFMTSDMQPPRTVTKSHFTTVYGSFKCNSCDKYFESANSLQTHTAKKHKLICEECGKLFYSSYALQVHISTHHSIKCRYCGEELDSRDSIHQHLLEKHEGQVKCKHCASLVAKDSLEKHMEKNHRVKCEHCGDVFLSLNILNRHRSIMHPADTRKCHVCNKTLANQNVLKTHMNTEHRSPSMWKKCNHCNMLFNSRITLNEHILQSHKKPSVKCEICHESFESRDILENHKKLHKIQCKHCSVLVDQGSMEDHMRSEHMIKCEHCNEVFPTIGTFNQHRSSKHPTLTRKCRLCNVTLENQMQLNLHLITQHRYIHNEKQNFMKCEYCDEVLESKSLLEKHCFDKHSNKIKCKHCTTLVSADSMDDHIKALHMRKCEHCNEFFTSVGYLNQHRSSRHPRLSRKCHLCNETLENQKRLDSHLVIHHRYIPCKLCSRSYLTTSSIESHMLRHHPLKCRHCNKEFELRILCHQHMIEEHGEGFMPKASLSELSIAKQGKSKSECEICGKLLASKETLRIHMRSQHYIKCGYCDEVLEPKSSLDQHYIDKHLGSSECDHCQALVPLDSTEIHLDKMHRMNCEHCDEVLPTVGSLYRHNLDHHANISKCYLCNQSFNKTMIDSHLVADHGYIQCEICPRSYAQRYSVRSHVEKMHPLKCNHCDVDFQSRILCYQHMIEKHQESTTTFKCSICGSTWASKKLLSKHYFRRHGMNESEIPKIRKPEVKEKELQKNIASEMIEIDDSNPEKREIVIEDEQELTERVEQGVAESEVLEIVNKELEEIEGFETIKQEIAESEVFGTIKQELAESEVLENVKQELAESVVLETVKQDFAESKVLETVKLEVTENEVKQEVIECEVLETVKQEECEDSEVLQQVVAECEVLETVKQEVTECAISETVQQEVTECDVSETIKQEVTEWEISVQVKRKVIECDVLETVRQEVIESEAPRMIKLKTTKTEVTNTKKQDVIKGEILKTGKPKPTQTYVSNTESQTVITENEFSKTANLKSIESEIPGSRIHKVTKIPKNANTESQMVMKIEVPKTLNIKTTENDVSKTANLKSIEREIPGNKLQKLTKSPKHQNNTKTTTKVQGPRKSQPKAKNHIDQEKKIEEALNRPGSFKCGHCKICFETKKLLLQHLPMHSKSSSKQEKNVLNRKDVWKHATQTKKCLFCKEALANDVKIIDSHLVEVHKIHQCDICNNLYYDKKALATHLSRTHDIFECEICEERFNSRSIGEHLHEVRMLCEQSQEHGTSKKSENSVLNTANNDVITQPTNKLPSKRARTCYEISEPLRKRPAKEKS